VEAVERARPAVVNIQCERGAAALPHPGRPEALPAQQRSNGMGTGIIIDPRGYIVTNHHVIEEVSLVRVRLHDGTPYIARVLDRDRDHDLALLKIDPARPLPIITIGTSSDLMVGETVIAIGNAYGYEHTVTVGIISALHRDVSLNKEVSYKSLIQTDASINPGNSGGPLLNVDGELIGVNVAIRAGAQGIGFAIPCDQMVQVVTEMLARRRQAEVWPGLVYRNRVDPRQSPPWSFEVDRVEASGPADKAGIRSGDVIVRLGDVAIANSLDFERALLHVRPGESVPVRVRRGDGEVNLELVLQASPAPLAGNELAWKRLGIRLAPAAAEAISRSNGTLRGGLLVTEVQPNGPGAKAGIQRGDILVGLHQWETLNFDNVHYVLRHPELASFYPLKVFLLRQGQIYKGLVMPE
jgi:serine protease Do